MEENAMKTTTTTNDDKGNASNEMKITWCHK